MYRHPEFTINQAVEWAVLVENRWWNIFIIGERYFEYIFHLRNNFPDNLVPTEKLFISVLGVIKVISRPPNEFKHPTNNCFLGHFVEVGTNRRFISDTITSLALRQSNDFPVSVKQTWRILLYSQEPITNRDITLVQQSPTKPMCIQYIPRNMHTVFALLCLWLYIDWFSHIHQAYFTGTVAI